MLQQKLEAFGYEHPTTDAHPGRHFPVGVPRPALGVFCFDPSGNATEIEVYATVADAKKTLAVPSREAESKNYRGETTRVGTTIVRVARS